MQESIRNIEWLLAPFEFQPQNYGPTKVLEPLWNTLSSKAQSNGWPSKTKSAFWKFHIETEPGYY
jgi:hypothetical protein